jgi:Tfp pilus assembly protein PilZ
LTKNHGPRRTEVITLKVICPTSGDFSARYMAEFPNGGFFIPTRLSPKPGEAVMVSLRIGSRATPVMLRASVRWSRRGKIVPKVRAGVAVEFLASEANGRDHLLAIAQRDSSVTSARRHQRLPIDLPIRWSVRGSSQEHRGLLQDISIGGASIRTALPVESEGTDIFLTVVPPGAEVAMEVSARIAWMSPGVGFGLAWRARDGGGSRRIKELVRRMEQLTEDRDSHDAFPEDTSPPGDSRTDARATAEGWEADSSSSRTAGLLQLDGLASRWAS